MSGADAPSDEGELHPGNYRPLMSEQRAQRIRRRHEGAYCRAKDSLGGRQMWPVSNAVNTAGIRSTRVSAKSCSRSAARRVQANAARISSAAYGGDSTNRATSPTPASGSHNPTSTMVASDRACSWDNCRARAAIPLPHPHRSMHEYRFRPAAHPTLDPAPCPSDLWELTAAPSQPKRYKPGLTVSPTQT
jgi:hypothetical protein